MGDGRVDLPDVLLRGLDKAISIQQAPVASYVARRRRAQPDATRPRSSLSWRSSTWRQSPEPERPWVVLRPRLALGLSSPSRSVAGR